MKTYPPILIVAFVLAAGSTGHAAAPNAVEVLSDGKMAGIEGGICPYFRCEGGDGDGTCQPIGDDAVDLCAHMTCRLELDSANGTDIVECKVQGDEPVTCTQVATYVRCIQSAYPSVCFPDPGSEVCGEKTDSYCFPDVKNRRCYCDTGTGDTPCDWNSCLY